jgi:hypothetical protein
MTERFGEKEIVKLITVPVGHEVGFCKIKPEMGIEENGETGIVTGALPRDRKFHPQVEVEQLIGEERKRKLYGGDTIVVHWAQEVKHHSTSNKSTQASNNPLSTQPHEDLIEN